MKILNLVILLISLNCFAQNDSYKKYIEKLKSETNIDNQDMTVFNLLDEFYMQVLQSDAGELSPEIPKEIDKLYQNKETKNRHLLVMFMIYQEHITQALEAGKRSKFQIDMINDLANEFNNISNRIPVLIYVYKFEALDISGQNDEAIKVLNQGLTKYPDSVPLKVYKFSSSKDENSTGALIFIYCL
jgi:hypothetical protein